MKLVVLNLLLFNISIFASPIQLLSCSDESSLIHVRLIPKRNILDVYVSSNDVNESKASFSKVLSDEDMNLVKAGSWSMRLKNSHNESLYITISQNIEAQVMLGYYPRVMHCQRLSSDEQMEDILRSRE